MESRIEAIADEKRGILNDLKQYKGRIYQMKRRLYEGYQSSFFQMMRTGTTPDEAAEKATVDKKSEMSRDSDNSQGKVRPSTEKDLKRDLRKIMSSVQGNRTRQQTRKDNPISRFPKEQTLKFQTIEFQIS